MRNMNNGLELITNRSELITLCKLNMQASTQAKQSGAWDEALKYIRIENDMIFKSIPSCNAELDNFDPWKDEELRDITSTVSLSCLFLEYLNRNASEGDKIFESIKGNGSKTDIAKASFICGGVRQLYFSSLIL